MLACTALTPLWPWLHFQLDFPRTVTQSSGCIHQCVPTAGTCVSHRDLGHVLPSMALSMPSGIKKITTGGVFGALKGLGMCHGAGNGRSPSAHLLPATPLLAGQQQPGVHSPTTAPISCSVSSTNQTAKVLDTSLRELCWPQLLLSALTGSISLTFSHLCPICSL